MNYIVTMQAENGAVMNVHYHAANAAAARDAVVEYWLSLGEVGQCLTVKAA